MTTAIQPLPPSPVDRLGLAILAAVTLHGLLILGVTFDLEKGRNARTAGLEIVLVHSKGAAPDTPDYLAQENQRGGGNVRERSRPSSPFPNARPIQERGSAAETRQATAPLPEPDRPRGMVVTRGDSPWRASGEERQPRPDLRQPSAAELMQSSLEQARISAEIDRSQKAYAQMPRQEWVTANTRKYDTAAYEESWREKVERIGNMNYPEEARRQKLTGALIVDVAIRPDGNLASVKVQRSSGKPVLDEAALRIVRLSAPFSPFSESMRRRMDVLHIVRTWQFEDNALTSR